MKLKLKKFLEKLPECEGKMEKTAIKKTRGKFLTIYWPETFEGDWIWLKSIATNWLEKVEIGKNTFQTFTC